MTQLSEKKFPVDAKEYKLYEEVGEGVSASVYRALCVPLNEIVAIKVLDLEKCNNDLDGIRREVQMMTLIDHPNLLRAHCSFTAGHNLWVVMPYMAGGSCLHIMKSSFPEGFEEPVIATLLREVLRALVYLHAHGHIHRDVKAGNILVDSNGSIKLADFGVSACMFDTGDRQRSRNTFVGTPCWMAPEVMQQLHGYDFKADIWSFGITALELAHGHAPFSKYPPMKVLLMTLQNAPPGLDYERDKKFSKSFKEMVAACLVKDPKKRPSSEKLLKHPFFKHARTTDYLSRTILDGLSPLGDRFRMIKANEADLLLQNKAINGDKEHLSQQEYIRGISAWNFNLEDLKNQAALIRDYDDVSNAEDPNPSTKQEDTCNHDVSPPELTSEEHNPFEVAANLEPLNMCDTDHPTLLKLGSTAFDFNNFLPQAALNDIPDLENSLASFPIKPLQALKGCFDVCEDDEPTGSPSWRDEARSDGQQNAVKSSSIAEDQEAERNVGGEHLGKSNSFSRSANPVPKRFLSGSLLQENVQSPKKVNGDTDRDHLQPRPQCERNFSGPLQYRQKSNNSLSADDITEGAVVRKGRFKVTSADLSPKASSNSVFSPVPAGLVNPVTSTIPAASVLPSLHTILHQNQMQKEELFKLIKYVEQSSGNSIEFTDVGPNEISQMSNVSTRERELQSQVIQLQQNIGSLVEELQRQKMKTAQLEKKLSIIAKKEEIIKE